MRKNFITLISILILCSCQKHFTFNQDATSEYLQAHLLPADYNQVDWSTLKNATVDGYIRLGFLGKSIATDFILLTVNQSSGITGGKIIQTTFRGRPEDLNATLIISNLDRRYLQTQEVYDGYVEQPAAEISLQRGVSQSLMIEQTVVPVMLHMVPAETSSGPHTAGFPYWLFEGLSGNNHPVPSGPSHTYTRMVPTLEGGGGGSGSSKTQPPNNMVVDNHYYGIHQPLDMQKMLSCFASIPDQGASCSVALYTDIPVDTDPEAMFSFRTVSPGHTFLKITKSVNGRQITQNLGFYPVSGTKAMAFYTPTDALVTDDANHEWNAGMNMTITPAQLQILLNNIAWTARTAKYDVDDYNCTDFAVNMFNTVRVADPINVTRFFIPGAARPGGSQTPQGLFLELRRRKQLNNGEAANIQVNAGSKSYSGYSQSPCK